MQVVGQNTLDKLSRRHSDVRGQVESWLAEVEEAKWRTPNDIKARYAHASFLADNRVVFNLKGNSYRLDTKVDYKLQIVLVVRAGTHAEYLRWKF